MTCLAHLLLTLPLDLTDKMILMKRKDGDSGEFYKPTQKKKKDRGGLSRNLGRSPAAAYPPLFSNPSLPPLTLFLYSSTPTFRCTPATSGLSDTGPSCVTASQQFMLCLIELQGPLRGVSAQLQISRVILIGPAGPTPLPTTRMEMKAPDSIVTTIRGL